jgi:polysaccharide export outer membrane protein
MKCWPYNASLSLLVAIACGSVCGAHAQDTVSNYPLNQAQSTALPAAVDEPANPQLKPNAIDALRKFEPPADEEYTLGRGDEITIDFSGRPESQAKLVIGPDGRISLPVAGEVMIAGLTRTGSATAVEAALAPYYSNVSAQVTVTRYTANRVLVLGAVDHPGSYSFESTPTLLEALTRGGLPKTGPNNIPDVPDECAIYRGSNQVMRVELRKLVESGNPLADLRLRRDDVVYVPNMTDHFVSVLGEVAHPGPVQLSHASTLASVLASAGGTTDKAGLKPRIQIIDPSTGKSRVLSMNDVLNPLKSSEITLKPGQIIYVPRSGWNKATYFMERLAPLTELTTLLVLDNVL